MNTLLTYTHPLFGVRLSAPPFQKRHDHHRPLRSIVCHPLYRVLHLLVPGVPPQGAPTARDVADRRWPGVHLELQPLRLVLHLFRLRLRGRSPLHSSVPRVQRFLHLQSIYCIVSVRGHYRRRRRGLAHALDLEAVCDIVFFFCCVALVSRFRINAVGYTVTGAAASV